MTDRQTDKGGHRAAKAAKKVDQQIQDHQTYMIRMLRVCDEEENPQNIV